MPIKKKKGYFFMTLYLSIGNSITSYWAIYNHLWVFSFYKCMLYNVISSMFVFYNYQNSINIIQERKNQNIINELITPKLHQI